MLCGDAGHNSLRWAATTGVSEHLTDNQARPAGARVSAILAVVVIVRGPTASTLAPAARRGWGYRQR